MKSLAAAATHGTAFPAINDTDLNLKVLRSNPQGRQWHSEANARIVNIPHTEGALRAEQSITSVANGIIFPEIAARDHRRGEPRCKKLNTAVSVKTIR